jgi:hypothetical protein
LGHWPFSRNNPHPHRHPTHALSHNVHTRVHKRLHKTTTTTTVWTLLQSPRTPRSVLRNLSQSQLKAIQKLADALNTCTRTGAAQVQNPEGEQSPFMKQSASLVHAAAAAARTTTEAATQATMCPLGY